MTHKENQSKIYSMAETALLTAVLCLSSYLVIPLPFTASVLSMQTVAVSLISLLLKPRRSFSCILIYLLLGVIGLPVFSGGTSGIGKLLGPTGGFYFGFLISALLVSTLKEKKADVKYYIAVTVLVSVPVQHIMAILVMCFHNGFNIPSAILSISLPFIFGDIVKCIAASVLAIEIQKRIKKSP